jgi:hypothetical protein
MASKPAPHTVFAETKMPELAAELLRRAEMCRQNAESAARARDKADWITLAKEWHSVAEEADPKG